MEGGAVVVDIFKVETGYATVCKIDRQSYERATGMKKRFRRKTRNGESLFAVCPACDNPIQIIGLYRNTPESGKKPYGRHFGQSIPDLAEYDEEAYWDCPFADPSDHKPRPPRRIESRLSKQILETLYDQFDRVIYILAKDTDVSFSFALARKMLEGYLAREGWSFRDAAPYNLPWTFPEGQVALPLYGQRVKRDSEVFSAISQHCKNVEWKETSARDMAILQKKGEQYLDLNFAFVNHSKIVQDEHLNESIEFWVYQGSDPEKGTVYRKDILIQSDYFMNLIALPPERSFRNEKLLELAHTMLEDYVKK